MRRDRWMLFGGVTAALVLAFVATALAALSSSAGSSAPTVPLAIVLLPDAAGSKLVVVDLQRHMVVRKVRLRSLVTGIGFEKRSGLVVGAQSGGVGDAADDAVSLVNPRSGGVRYVRLPWSDPVSVTCAEGSAFVLHAVVDPQGLACSVVNPVSGSIVATGHAPDGPGVWGSALGRLWTVGLGRTGAWSLISIVPSTLATEVVPVPGIVPRGVVDAGDVVALLGDDGSASPGGARVALLDERGSVVTSATAPDLRYAARMATAAGPWLVVGDWSGDEPESRRLELFDRATLRRARPIRVNGVPCALAASGDHLLVVDRLGGRLLEIDPGSGVVISRVDLGARDLIYSAMVVVPGGGTPVRVSEP